MRIIAGSARGRKLVSPPSAATRPTQDRVREAIFSVIGDVHDAVVVDAFAGSGALGLEALSRGARRCYFFDASRKAIETIQENTRRLAMEDYAEVHRCDFRRGLAEIVEGTPDLWFLDPPYGTALITRSLEAMAGAQDKVTPGALLVWESGKEEDIPKVDRFEVVDQRLYGSTRILFFRCR